MGAICSNCFGSSTRSNQESHHHNHYHRFDSIQNSSSALNPSKGKGGKSPVIYSHQTNISSAQSVSTSSTLSSQHLQKSGSNSSLNKGNQQVQFSQDSTNKGQSGHGHSEYDQDESESQQRAMKKIDSSKYLLKHSNLSAILEEDEQHKDSVKLIQIKQQKDGKKHANSEGQYPQQPQSLIFLQNVEDSSDVSHDESNQAQQSTNQTQENYSDMRCNQVNNAAAAANESDQHSVTNHPPIHTQTIGDSIQHILPNYQELSASAMQHFSDIISQDCESQNYSLEHNQSDQPSNNHGRTLFSKVYVKPVEDGKYKYFKIRTEYNLYGCSAREYLRFTSDPEESKANNSSIDEFITVSCQDDYHIMYITYKKILMCSPRDFIYLKYNKQINSTTYITVQFSIDIASHPPLPNKERGIIVLSGSIISEEKDSNGQTYIKLINYAESNLKLSLNHKIMKSSTVKEIKKYIHNLQQLFLKRI